MELTTLERIKDEAEEETIRRYLIRKQNLLAELEHVRNSGTSSTETTDEFQLELTHDLDNVVLSIQVDEGRLIHAIIVFAEGLFPNGESHAVHLSPPTSSARMPLPVQRNLAVDLHVNLLVGFPSNELLKVIETVHPLPTFSCFKSVPWLTASLPSTRYRVKTRLQERIQRVKFNLVPKARK